MNPSYLGISIIGIGGQNYKTFLSLIHDFNIDWFIFSDGEEKTRKTVKKAVSAVFGIDINVDPSSNIIILDNEEDFEMHLINNGYVDEVVEAVKERKFHIYAISTIEQGIEILTGVPAGKKDKDGKFPAGTVNYLVYEKLKKYAKICEK